MSAHLVDNLKFLLLGFGIVTRCDKLNVGTVAAVSNDSIGELVLESSKGLHQHESNFERALKSSIVGIEAEHTVGRKR